MVAQPIISCQLILMKYICKIKLSWWLTEDIVHSPKKSEIFKKLEVILLSLLTILMKILVRSSWVTMDQVLVYIFQPWWSARLVPHIWRIIWLMNVCQEELNWICNFSWVIGLQNTVTMWTLICGILAQITNQWEWFSTLLGWLIKSLKCLISIQKLYQGLVLTISQYVIAPINLSIALVMDSFAIWIQSLLANTDNTICWKIFSSTASRKSPRKIDNNNWELT